jgi:thioester reductase-like protein
MEGDITRADLGVGRVTDLKKRVTDIHHLAAVYDLGVRRELAMRVNAEGTRHLLEFARQCPTLARFHYVSTCYVSGRYAGVFTEDHLEEGQAFNNSYEESKYVAEVAVRRAMRDGLAATIYRPSIVVGDSRTGATQKYDGLYFGIRLLLRQPGRALMPVVGDPSRTEFNVVPCDFVLDGIAYLGGLTGSVGQVYHLADPEPLTLDEMLVELARATGRTMTRVRLPLVLAKAALDWLPGIHRLSGIPSNALDYMVHPTRYGTAKTQAALAGSEIRCPRVPAYLERLVQFVREHPDVGGGALA